MGNCNYRFCFVFRFHFIFIFRFAFVFRCELCMLISRAAEAAGGRARKYSKEKVSRTLQHFVKCKCDPKAHKYEKAGCTNERRRRPQALKEREETKEDKMSLSRYFCIFRFVYFYFLWTSVSNKFAIFTCLVVFLARLRSLPI